MSRKKLAWANKEVETFVCILGEEDVVYDVYVAAAAIDIRPTTKGTVGSGNATSELSWAISPPPYRTFAIRSVPHPAVEKRHKSALGQSKGVSGRAMGVSGRAMGVSGKWLRPEL
ncbi:unnamed protein product [Boreogadus saida]